MPHLRAVSIITGNRPIFTSQSVVGESTSIRVAVELAVQRGQAIDRVGVRTARRNHHVEPQQIGLFAGTWRVDTRDARQQALVRRGLMPYQVWITPATRKRLKIEAARRDTFMVVLGGELIKQGLERGGPS